ncbi:hypothetical protein WA026_005861 [Henosepilachna vigintioctopunctata]|uniref:Succinate dehydrogenase cytochrome b560 subunit, mitochondrial n=1 Tax=Henosepilachna vigintioctopunctata TaxID=420089 RepID=A0AAW1U3D5_9CUCU
MSILRIAFLPTFRQVSNNLCFKRLLSSHSTKLLCGKTPASYVLCQQVHIEPRIAKEPSKPCDVDYHDKSNMEKGRPMSPFITIYATEIQGVASIHNRITGAVCAMQIATFAVLSLILPESVDYYVHKINSWNLPVAVIFFAKYLNAWPWCYHIIDGTRHLIWDLTSFLTSKSVIISSWLVIFLAVCATMYVSTL